MENHGRILETSRRVYRILTRAYPEDLRDRYGEEMVRCFGDLCRQELRNGGLRGLAALWARTLAELAYTALKERSTMLARNSYLPVGPGTAARVMAAIVLVSVTVAVASLVKPPQYQASTMVLIGKQASEQPIEVEAEELRAVAQTMAEITRSRQMAEDAIKRLGLSTTPEVLLERLDAEPIKDTPFIEVSYTDPNPEKARLVANTVGETLSRRVSEVSPSVNAPTATLWERAVIPDEPVSPNPLRNGVLTLVFGLMLCVGLAFALPRVAASGIGRVARRTTSAVDRAASGTRRMPAVPLATKAAQEKELLAALGRCGKLTAVEAALETSLSVEQADLLLSELASKGHLEVRIKDGRMLYSFWESDG